jgi:hypothetical protein
VVTRPRPPLRWPLPPSLLFAVALSACSGKARTDGAGSAHPAGSAGSADAAGSAGSADAAGSAGSAAAPAPTGDVQIRVEWADVPAVARASPGRTPCNTPRSPSVAPTATWGIPDAIVLVEGARSDSAAAPAGSAAAPAGSAAAPADSAAAPADAAEARIVLADCALSPRVAIGSSLLIESAVDRPATVTLAKRADLSRPEAASAPPSTPPRTLRLPIAGHAVAVPLEAGGAYQLATADKAPETAWLIAPQPRVAAAVTDPSGQATLRGVPPGPHAVIAWLPPRAGQPARIARGTITAAVGALAELTLQLAPVSALAP